MSGKPTSILMIPNAKFEEGIKCCETNAFNSFREAEKLITQGDYRQAYFFGIIALEETGKAGFIIEKMRQPQISKKEWCDKKTFMGHASKIEKAKEVFEQDIVDSLHKELPGFRGIKPAIIGWSEKELEQLWEYRNRVLFVGYNFDKGEWKCPQDIPDLEKRTREVLEKALSTFLALESQLVKIGIEPELKRV